jgi:hypothetical protein
VASFKRITSVLLVVTQLMALGAVDEETGGEYYAGD